MKRPYVVCHMLTSIDGKIDGEFFESSESLSALRRFEKARDFYECNAVLYGTTTMERGYSNGRINSISKNGVVYPRKDYVAKSEVENYIVSVDPEGILAFDGKYIERKNREKYHIIEILTDKVSNEYLSYLRALDISYIFAGEDRLDCRLTLEKLRGKFSIEKLMISGGGFTNWSFAESGLIDELSIVVSPVADGNRFSASIFEKADFLPRRSPISFTLKSADTFEGGILWLRYLFKK